MSRVHSDELGVPEGIPDDGVLVIRTGGQETRKNKLSEFMKRHGDVKNSGIERQNLLSSLVPLQTVDAAGVTLNTHMITT